MDAQQVAVWMLSQMERDNCVYQDDVVDHIIHAHREDLLAENANGNQVVGRDVLTAFRTLTNGKVVWVKSDRYWRFRVPEDEPGREARG